MAVQKQRPLSRRSWKRESSRFFIFISVLVSPLLIAAYPEKEGDQIGFMGGGGLIQTAFGCHSAQMGVFETAAQYKHTFKDGNWQVGAYGHYELQHYDGISPYDKEEHSIDHSGDSYTVCEKYKSEGMFSDSCNTFFEWNHHAVLSLYGSYTGNRYFGVSLGITSDLVYPSEDGHSSYYQARPALLSPIMPSLEFRLGAMDLAYFAVRFMHPDLALDYDFAGADIVVTAIPRLELAVGTEYDHMRYFSINLLAKAKLSDLVSLPLSARLDIARGFTFTAGLEFNF